MRTKKLLSFQKSVFSQNGEDGILAEIFRRLGVRAGIACEFGAWDGIHLSNIRNLVLKGWQGIFIEPDPKRFQHLARNYQGFKNVVCLNRSVETGSDGLLAIFKEAKINHLAKRLDLLCIDIDGLDYLVFQDLNMTPKLTMIEVNVGHSPDIAKRIPREIAANDIGQPLGVISKIAKVKDYSLICYNGNAFYLKNSLVRKHRFPILTNREAYLDYLHSLSPAARKWFFSVNLGKVAPHYQFRNPYLSAKNLGLNHA